MLIIIWACADCGHESAERFTDCPDCADGQRCGPCLAPRAAGSRARTDPQIGTGPAPG